jgi:hypothetical protein
MVCANCTLFEGPRSCDIVAGDIDPAAVCKFWIIPEALLASTQSPDAAPTDGSPARAHEDPPSAGHFSTPTFANLRRKARETGAI